LSTALKNPGELKDLPDSSKFRFGILVSEWNPEITGSLFKAAYNTLISCGTKKKNIVRQNVPGSFELSSGAQIMAATGKFDAIICLGCVIQGETRHFDFICNAVSIGITQVSIQYKLPVIFGVLTTQTLEQAQARSGGKYGNKGEEAAIAAIKMAALKKAV
jgi:6,7-dimethyl-8-ribityllumazine synthase